jgi:hyperosmotically inducible protein
MKISTIVKAITLTSALTCASLTYAGAVYSDSQIISTIKAEVNADKTTATLPVQITISKGVVNLSGKVNTDEEANQLIQIAESTQGVSDVNTQSLKVKESQHKMSDSTITAKIKGVYIREKLFGSKDISVTGVTVETTDGVVYLTGTVDSQSQADNAIKLAKSISGVKKVDSKLAVKSVS